MSNPQDFKTIIIIFGTIFVSIGIYYLIKWLFKLLFYFYKCNKCGSRQFIFLVTQEAKFKKIEPFSKTEKYYNKKSQTLFDKKTYDYELIIKCSQCNSTTHTGPLYGREEQILENPIENVEPCSYCDGKKKLKIEKNNYNFTSNGAIVFNTFNPDYIICPKCRGIGTKIKGLYGKDNK